MPNFDNFYSSYEYTEAPPIITEEYKSVKDTFDYLNNPNLTLQQENSVFTPVEEQPAKPFDNWGWFDEEDKEDNFTTIANGIINMAKSFVGGRYVLGRQDPNNKMFDCSGLVNYVFGLFGIKVPRTTSLLNKNGHRINKEEVHPGDLALFIPKGKTNGHVGLVADVNGDKFTMIDARGKKYGIVQRELSKDSVTTFLRYIPDSTNSKSVVDQINGVIPRSGYSTNFDNPESYTKNMYNIFYNELERQGINGELYAPLLVAHTSIESAWGKSGLSKNANNYGGIKGKEYKASTKEYSKDRGYYRINSSFKSYASVEEFAKDYVTMLKNKFKAFDVAPSQYVTQLRSHKYFTAALEDYQKSFDSRLKKVYKYLEA